VATPLDNSGPAARLAGDLVHAEQVRAQRVGHLAGHCVELAVDWEGEVGQHMTAQALDAEQSLTLSQVECSWRTLLDLDVHRYLGSAQAGGSARRWSITMPERARPGRCLSASLPARGAPHR
jgi:hypothetical protein